MSGEYKKLYRSRQNRMVAGVCAGLAEYLNIDPTLVRLLFAIGTVFGFGSLILVYIVLMIVIPEEPFGGSVVVQPAPETPEEEE